MARLVNIDRETPMLLPFDMREWLPENHIVHFILDAVRQLNLRNFKINERGTGSEQYPPDMMLSLLIYSYSKGIFSSRAIERATYDDIAVRYICGGDRHPDHDTICKFRRENEELFSECFVKVLSMASLSGCLKKVGGISVDGTKIKANASKHSAVSYKRAGELIEILKEEVKELVKKAEGADSTPLDDGLTIPDEIRRREERINKLEEARIEIEKEFRKEESSRKDSKSANIKNKSVPDKKQYNFTDNESHIMKSGSGQHFEQAYNAQAAVDTEGSYLILGQRVTNKPTDKQELKPDVDTVSEEVRNISYVTADSGFYSEQAVKYVEMNGDTICYISVKKTKYHKSIKDIEKHSDPQELPDDASCREKMEQRLKTKEGKEKYNLRKQTVEPVFGIIKHVMGFRQFLMRGLNKVKIEWTLVTLAYNFKRLFNIFISKGIKIKVCG